MRKERREKREEGRKMVVEQRQLSIFPGSLFILFFFSSFFFLPSSFSADKQADFPKKICLRDACLNIEVADTDIERARGLQERKSLEDDYGMLFVFETEGMYNFWMKDTLVPLDMIWIDKDRKIVDIKTYVPPCTEDPCPTYNPAGESLYVLETKAGLSTVLNYKVGDELTFK